MAKGYWLVNLDIFDAEKFEEYGVVVRPFLAKHGARFLTRVEAHDVVEGAGRARHNVIEFDSYELAKELYNSDEYQAMVPLRQAGAHADFVITAGNDI